jgi:hypothetical protein
MPFDRDAASHAGSWILTDEDDLSIEIVIQLFDDGWRWDLPENEICDGPVGPWATSWEAYADAASWWAEFDSEEVQACR